MFKLGVGVGFDILKSMYDGMFFDYGAMDRRLAGMSRVGGSLQGGWVVAWLIFP